MRRKQLIRSKMIDEQNSCRNEYLLHFSGATVIMLSIADDSVMPRNDAVPLISVPRSDQFNCTESDMCFEQNCCIKSASLLRT